MKKKIMSVVGAFILMASMIQPVYATEMNVAADRDVTEPVATISEAYIPSEPSEPEEVEEVIVLDVVEIERVDPATQAEAEAACAIVEERLEHALNVYNSLIEMGYPEDHPAVVLAATEVENNEADKTHYKKLIGEFRKARKWAQHAAEYPAATEIWLYMKNLGWSDAVCAGIMGNLMAEVGGQTLNINYGLYSSSGSYYGMCQWSNRYYGSIHGMGLRAQCNFLRDTIKKELDTYGYMYKSGMNFSKFLSISSPSEAALCFAKAYERCGSGSYSVRQRNAQVAYDYFTS